MIFKIKSKDDDKRVYEEQQRNYYYGRVHLLFPNAETDNIYIEAIWRHKILCLSLSDSYTEYRRLYSHTLPSKVYEYLALSKTRKYL